MSAIAELKRQLEAARESIEALDDALSAGRLSPEEHARQCGDRERLAGRLYVTLRRAQREQRADAPAERAVAPVARASDARRSLTVATLAVLLVLAGVAAGFFLGPRRHAAESPAASTAVPSTAPPGDAPAAINPAELLALRQAASRDDAATPTLLQFGHVMLDQGQVAEARRTYERVLARDPKDVEAITHLGAVLYQEGQIDQALAKVDEALQIDPQYVHALWDRTQYLYHGKKDYAAAARAAQAFLTVVPTGRDADTIKALLAEARRKIASGDVPAQTLR